MGGGNGGGEDGTRLIRAQRGKVGGVRSCFEGRWEEVGGGARLPRVSAAGHATERTGSIDDTPLPVLSTKEPKP